MKDLNAEWKKFEKMVVPEVATESQRTDMRVCFIAGATSLLCMLMDADEEEVEKITADVEGQAVWLATFGQLPPMAKQEVSAN